MMVDGIMFIQLELKTSCHSSKDMFILECNLSDLFG